MKECQSCMGHKTCETTCQQNERSLWRRFYTVFSSLIMVQQFQKAKVLTAKFYKKVVLKKLQKYFYKRHPKLGLKSVSLLHDNASSHKVQILKQQKVWVLPHPAYSPDLAPCDYFLFPTLKSILAGKRYASRKALGSAVGQCLRHIPASDYERCFYNWIKRLKLCVKAKGEYSEGMCWIVSFWTKS